jgi:putative phosphoribosyl transferase
VRYYKNRTEAGQKLAQNLIKYRTENTAVVALSEGAVLVGEAIAKQLNSTLSMLVTDDIYVPGEHVPLATMTSAGSYTYNTSFSAGQIEEFVSEYRGVIDQKRIESFQKMNRIIGKDGELDIRLLKRHIVILVSDGLKSGLSLDVAADFLKPIQVKRLIVATPISSVPALDRMHILSDEIQCLDVLENFISTNHYYDDNEIPGHKEIMSIMKNIVFSWSTEKNNKKLETS